MKIDLVSRYFKPLKYSENVIRYVPKLPLSLLLLVASQTTAPIIFPPGNGVMSLWKMWLIHQQMSREVYSDSH